MATITQISDTKFRAQVRRSGHRTMAKTFVADSDKAKDIEKAKNAAIGWASDVEQSIDSGKKVGVDGKIGLLVCDGVAKYIKEMEPGRSAKSTLNSIGTSKILGKLQFAQLTDDNIVEYIKDKGFKASTGAFHVAILRSLCNYAVLEWNCYVPDVMEKAIKRLSKSKLYTKDNARSRRPTSEEIHALVNHDFPGEIPMGDIIMFAILSAMRRSEITRIEYATIKEGKTSTVVITDRKHPTKKLGNHQVVPLLDEALEIIKRQKKKEFDNRIFPYSGEYVGGLFSDACKKLGIEDLHFHDLRHEGTSRLFEMGYDIPKVRLFTGHEDVKMLMRYTHLKPDELEQLKTKKIEELATIGISHRATKDTGIVMDENEIKEFEEFKRFKKMQEMMAAQKAA